MTTTTNAKKKPTILYFLTLAILILITLCLLNHNAITRNFSRLRGGIQSELNPRDISLILYDENFSPIEERIRINASEGEKPIKILEALFSYSSTESKLSYIPKDLKILALENRDGAYSVSLSNELSSLDEKTRTLAFNQIRSTLEENLEDFKKCSLIYGNSVIDI